MKPIEISKEEFHILRENMEQVDITYELLDIIEEFDNELNFIQYQVYIPSNNFDHIVFLLVGKNKEQVIKYYKYIIEYKFPLHEEIDYVKVYKQNHFKVGSIDFTFEQLPKADFFAKPFAILTAWNPNNQLSLSRINAMYNNLLEKELKNLKVSFDRAVGYLDEHREESYCVYDISLAQAISIANKYDQYSIFYNDTNIIGYYKVDTSKVIIEKLLPRYT